MFVQTLLCVEITTSPSNNMDRYLLYYCEKDLDWIEILQTIEILFCLLNYFFDFLYDKSFVDKPWSDRCRIFICSHSLHYRLNL